MSAPRRRFVAAVQTIADDLNRLLNRTLSQQRLIVTPSAASPEGRERAQLSFRSGGRAAVAALLTHYGTVGLALGQVYETALGPRSTSPMLVAYRYALYAAANAEPVVRWEYDGRPADQSARWCRHHIQGMVPVLLGGQAVPLNELHMPTGEVPIEEVIGFCIVDLGAEPLSGDWNEILTETRL